MAGASQAGRQESPGGVEGSRRKRRGKTETLRVLHLDQGMTDSIPADHLSGPLFDDKAHPLSAIHYRLSLPEARASIMLPLRDDARPPRRASGRPWLVGIRAHHYRAPIPHPTCRAADRPPPSPRRAAAASRTEPSGSQGLSGGSLATWCQGSILKMIV